jgi:lysophospholipase L1-like esterase
MKNYKYIGVLLLSIGVASCDVNNELDAITEEAVPTVQLNTGDLDFSNYVAVGASFTAGYTDGAMFKAAQENSFPNILATKFKVAGGGDFNQPLMNDNIGGLLFNGTPVQPTRFYFDGAGPARLGAVPTTELTTVLTGPFNNFGAPGAKSFHLGVLGYGQLNPYFGRMASSPTASVMGDVLAQSPTFFTLSEIGGNDVLGYALAGGAGVDQSPSTTNPTGNLNPATYGPNDITNPLVFADVFSSMVTALTANGAKGVVANLPYITSLSNFTTVPYNPVPLISNQAAEVNAGYATYNGALLFVQSNSLIDAAEVAKRTISFSGGQNAVVIVDEDLTNLTGFGIPSFRQATSDDLLVLASSAIIGTLADPNNPASVYGVGVPLGDQWVITPEEQMAIKTATDAYNATIETVAAANPNITMVDFKGVLIEAATSGISFDNYTMTTNLVTGGLVSLDGIHLTGRGYALMANRILGAMDTEFGSNFTSATNGLAKADDYPTNYSPSLQ